MSETEITTGEYRVWTDGTVISYEGTMRLSGTEAYEPIQTLMDGVLNAGPSKILLDLTGLEFLNSSGINLLAKYTISLRRNPDIVFSVKGTTRIPWQSKSLPNLKKLHPALTLEII